MLLKDITDIKRVMQTSAATSYDRLEPHIQNAEKAFIIPLLGKEMYDALEEYAADPANPQYINPSRQWPGSDPTDEKEKATALVLWHAQHAIINLAYFVGFDVLGAFVSDGGFRRLEGDTQKSLFKYQEDNLKRYFQETGMNSCDDMLEAVEAHIGHFPQFEEMLEKLRSNIIPDTKTFNIHYHINNSRIVFMRVKPHMKTVRELVLAKEIGEQNMAFILEELKKEEPGQKVKNILPYLRNPMAYLAVTMLMEETGAEVTERGLYFTGQRSIMNSDFVMPTNENRVTYLIERNRKIADQYLAMLRKHLNKEEWEGDFSRDSRLHNRDNSGKRTLWV